MTPRPREVDAEYSAGYRAGHTAGYTKGFDEGHASGYKDAKGRAYASLDAAEEAGVVGAAGIGEVRRLLEKVVGA